MLLDEAQDLARLAVGKWRFVALERAADRRLRAPALEEFGRRLVRGDRIIDGIEHLEAEPVFGKAQMHDLAEIARIDIGPGIALARRGIGDGSPVPVIFMWFDH